MSLSPTVRDSADLTRLVDEGYELDVQDGALIVTIPFLDAGGRVGTGQLLAKLDLAGDVTRPPRSHVAYFSGGTPHDNNGNRLRFIISDSRASIGGLTSSHQLSTKPPSGRYADYYHLVSAYAIAIASPAEAVDPTFTPRRRSVVDANESSRLRYHDTASAKAGVDISLLAGRRAAIIGLGGTGTYVLDLLAKIDLEEIRLYDDDELLQHSALRAPGVTSVEALRAEALKVDHWAGVYDTLHSGIVPRSVRFTPDLVSELEGFDVAFVCIDHASERRNIIDAVLAVGVSVIDSGIGLLHAATGALFGHVRVTLATPEDADHLDGHLPVGEVADAYGGNIQTAETNALAASLMVLRWKRHLGVYHDDSAESQSLFVVHGNETVNERRVESVIELHAEDPVR